MLFDKVSFVNTDSLMYLFFYVFSCYSWQMASKDAKSVINKLDWYIKERKKKRKKRERKNAMREEITII